MATIIKDKDQERALKKVNHDLQQLELLNDMLKQESFTLTATGQKKALSLDLTSEYNGKIYAIIDKSREKIIKEVNSLSAKYRLALADEDMAIMNHQRQRAAVEHENPVGESAGIDA